MNGENKAVFPTPESMPKGSVLGKSLVVGKHTGGLPRRPVDLTEVGGLLAEGHSLRQTARRLRVDYATIQEAVQDAGVCAPEIDNFAWRNV